MHTKVNTYISEARRWSREFELLRTYILDCGLTEEFKWRSPCYTYMNSNIVLIHGFKEYCALFFFKGALLQDEHGILIQQTENVQSARQVRFTGVHQIMESESILKEHIQEAVEVEKASLKVPLKKTIEYHVPEEFQTKLDNNPDLKDAFDALTPGRQRGYLLHFSKPKRSATREARMEKCIPQILMGKD